MKTIFNFIKTIFNNKKEDNVNPSITTASNSNKTNDEIVNVTSKSAGNTIEFTIELNE